MVLNHTATGALPHDWWGSTARSGGAQRLEYSLSKVIRQSPRKVPMSDLFFFAAPRRSSYAVAPAESECDTG